MPGPTREILIGLRCHLGLGVELLKPPGDSLVQLKVRAIALGPVVGKHPQKEVAITKASHGNVT